MCSYSVTEVESNGAVNWKREHRPILIQTQYTPSCQQQAEEQLAVCRLPTAQQEARVRTALYPKNPQEIYTPKFHTHPQL